MIAAQNVSCLMRTDLEWLSIMYISALIFARQRLDGDFAMQQGILGRENDIHKSSARIFTSQINSRAKI